MEIECVSCKASDQDERLNKCPICFKWTCGNCGVNQYGRIFCVQKCADAFFFGDEDDEE